MCIGIVYHEGVTCRDVADPLKVASAERETVDVEKVVVVRCAEIDDISSTRVCDVVVDEDWLALRDREGEPEINACFWCPELNAIASTIAARTARGIVSSKNAVVLIAVVVRTDAGLRSMVGLRPDPQCISNRWLWRTRLESLNVLRLNST